MLHLMSFVDRDALQETKSKHKIPKLKIFTKSKQVKKKKKKKKSPC